MTNWQRALCAGVLVLVAWACSTKTTLTAPPASNARTAGDCRVEIYPDRKKKPERPYEIITRAESHVQRNFFFGGKATLDDDAYTELRKQACRVGADAILIEDVIESKASEFSHIHLWAELVRFTDVETSPSAQ
jgi:hypothetical protein